MAKREKTKFVGVYRREATGRIFKGKPDVCFDIAYRDKNQKLTWEKVGWLSEGYSEKLADNVRSERLRAIRHGQDLPQEKKRTPLFRTVWEKYLLWASTNKARGARDDISLFKNCLEQTLAEKRLNEISAFDLERLKSSLLKKGYSPATVKHCLVLIRQVFNKALIWGMYQGGNPVKGVKMPTIQNERTRFLTREEAERLLKALSEMTRPDLHDMALLSLHTGMRAGEIFKLKGNDLDFNNKLIKILDPKNKKTRHAYMTKTVREMLLKRKPEAPENFVFPDRNGKKIVSISQSFPKIIKKLGFNKNVIDDREMVTFHSLRHTFASWLAMQGESLITIRDLLGHKTTAMTERYSHLIPDHKRRAAELLEDNFTNGNKIAKINNIKSI
jgi:integrase